VSLYSRGAKQIKQSSYSCKIGKNREFFKTILMFLQKTVPGIKLCFKGVQAAFGFYCTKKNAKIETAFDKFVLLVWGDGVY